MQNNELILSEKSLAYLKVIEDSETIDNLHIIKEGKIIKIFKNKQEYYKRTFEEALDPDWGADSTTEELNILNGKYTIYESYPTLLETFKINDYKYKTNEIITDYGEYKLKNEKFYINKDVYYNLVADKIYVKTNNDINEINTEEDIKKQLLNLKKDLESRKEKAKVAIKNSIKEILEENNLNTKEEDYATTIDNLIDRYNLKMFWYENNIDDLVIKIKKLKETYLKLKEYQEKTKKNIDKEISYLNNILEKQYDNYLENELAYEKELELLQAKYKVKKIIR